jgi:hypothetical protein
VIEAERARVPLLKTATSTPTAIAKPAPTEDSLAERIILHAVLMDVPASACSSRGEGIGRAIALDLTCAAIASPPTRSSSAPAGVDSIGAPR